MILKKSKKGFKKVQKVQKKFKTNDSQKGQNK